MATKLETLKLLRALLLLRVAVFENEIPNKIGGICWNVWFYYGDPSLIKLFLERCESFSGCMEFPVMGGHNAFLNNKIDKWTGEYGERRIKLLDELIMVIEIDIAEGKYA